MISPVTLHLYHGETELLCTACLSFSLEKEVYTPYDAITAEFLSQLNDYSQIDRMAVYLGETCIFFGLSDNIQLYQKNHVSLVRISSRSFTSLLTQNELEAGLHSNLTAESLLTGFYQFPYITYENLSGTGYIYVKSGNTMWDGIVSFGYKLTGHYPYIIQNQVCFSRPQNRPVSAFTSGQVLESGTVLNTTKLISHYHMEDINGNPNAYQQENQVASALNIVRHKQISFDRSFLHAPNTALTFRNLYSQRGYRANYLIYDGFRNENLGDTISYSSLIPNQTLCRLHATFGTNGFRTKLWCYQDGFYS